MDRNTLIAGVSIVFIVTAAVTTLIALGKDTGALMTVIGLVVVPLLAALGIGKLGEIRASQQQVQHQTNGTQTRMLSMLENAMEKLAKAQPIDDEDPGTRKPL